MQRNLIGASSALAILALLSGAPATGIAHENNDLCNVLLDGDGEPVFESDSDNIGHSNSRACEDGAVRGVDASAADTSDESDTPDETAVAAVPAPDVEPMVVYFDINKDSVDTGTRTEMQAYVAAIMATSPTSLNVVGYTDTSGPADLNARLSAARADSVAGALVEAGVPAEMIAIGASGEDRLALDTPDGTREASNRRVTITPTY